MISPKQLKVLSLWAHVASAGELCVNIPDHVHYILQHNGHHNAWTGGGGVDIGI